MESPCKTFLLPPLLELSGREVHVWSATLERDNPEVRELNATLSADEQARAAKFFCKKNRSRFIVRRGLLRKILGRYLGKNPERLEFCYSPEGKPALSQKCGGHTLSFSLSHSGGLALFAVTRLRAVGVDIERVRMDLPWEPVVPRLFSEREIVAFRALPASQQTEAFFNCWTRKEALLKATGEGISESLNCVEVSLRSENPPRVLRMADDSQAAESWSLRDLVPAPEYVGAIAIQEHNCRFVCGQWAG